MPNPDGTRTYRVEWAIDVYAESPEHAARQAWEIMRKPDSTADVFDVLEEGQEPAHVDLTEIDQERMTAES